MHTDSHGLILPRSAEAATWLRDFWETGRKLPEWNSPENSLRQNMSSSSVNEPQDNTVWGNILARAQTPQLEPDMLHPCAHDNNGNGDNENQLSSSPSPEARRTNLLVVPAGDDWRAERWLSHPNAATFDIVAIHHGEDANFTCPECLLVSKIKGPKWRLYYLFTITSEWEALVNQYDYVMLPGSFLLRKIPFPFSHLSRK